MLSGCSIFLNHWQLKRIIAECEDRKESQNLDYTVDMDPYKLANQCVAPPDAFAIRGN